MPPGLLPAALFAEQRGVGKGPRAWRRVLERRMECMHLQFIHAHSGQRMSSLPVIRRWRFVTILVVGLAGLIHLSLMREHFEEQFIYGLVFTALALFQFTLALLLGWRPGPWVYRAGIWGSGIVVLIYVLTRLIPLPGASGPEEVDLLGIAATSLEIAAVVLLAVALPEPEMTSRSHGAPLWWGLGGAVIVAPLWLILTGVVQWTSTVSPSPLTWTGTDSWSALTPILVGGPLPHVWLAAPWWSLPAAFVLAALVGLNLAGSTRLLLAGSMSPRGRRARLLALLPAGLAAPVCCSASTPLLALLGVPLFLGVLAAPFAALLSVVLLTCSLVFSHVQCRRVACSPGNVSAVLPAGKAGEATEQQALIPNHGPEQRRS